MKKRIISLILALTLLLLRRLYRECAAGANGSEHHRDNGASGLLAGGERPR